MKKTIAFILVACALLAVNSCGIIDEGGSGDTKGAVDLGLSVKWAACNLGASSPDNAQDRVYLE